MLDFGPLSAKDIRRRYDERHGSHGIKELKRRINQVLQKLEAAKLVVRDEEDPRRWQSGLLEPTSINEIRQLGASQPQQVSVQYVQEAVPVSQHFRFRYTAKWKDDVLDIQATSREQRTRHLAQVQAAHHLLGTLSVLPETPHVSHEFKRDARNRWRLGAIRGRTLQQGSYWNVSEAHVELKGGKNQDDPQDFEGFRKQFNCAAPKWLSAVINRYWLEHSRRFPAFASAMIVFGRHDSGRACGIRLPHLGSSSDPSNAFMDAQRWCKDRVMAALRNHFQIFIKSPHHWAAIDRALEECSISIAMLQPSNGHVRSDSNSSIVEVELHIQLSHLRVENWTSPCPYRRPSVCAIRYQDSSSDVSDEHADFQALSAFLQNPHAQG